jgi:hypothetical protein
MTSCEVAGQVLQTKPEYSFQCFRDGWYEGGLGEKAFQRARAADVA